jgi:carbon storage regulator
MLVLSRKLGEKIFIGDNICITIVDIDRGKIHIGIEAPRDISIYHQELLRNGVPPVSRSSPSPTGVSTTTLTPEG